MYSVLTKMNSFDRSPLQFGRWRYTKERIIENVSRYEGYRRSNPGRIASDHLFTSLLINLNVPFSGDLDDYMSKVERATRRLAPTMGLVTGYSKGQVFTEGVVYPGCMEIITCTSGRYTPMDLWGGWRDLASVTVTTHPVTESTLFDPVVVNKAVLSNPGLVVMNIDLPLMAAQYIMYKANGGSGYEDFIVTTVLPGIVRSHIDVCMFNKVAARFGVIEPCLVKTNLPFAQNDTDTPMDQVADDIYKALSGKSLQPRQILSTIPAVYDTDYLSIISALTMPATNQAIWALEASRFVSAALALELSGIHGDGRFLELIIKIKRNLIQAEQEGWYTTSLTMKESKYLKECIDTLIVPRLPA